MEENGAHEPLLQCNESIETDRDRDSKADGSVPLNYDADAAPLPMVSESSSKWKYKYHCVLSGDEFCESHNHSEGTLRFFCHKHPGILHFHEL
jgi:hypothetical protein